MPRTYDELLTSFDQHGYALLTEVVTADRLEALIGQLSSTLDDERDSTLQSRGQTYGSRNLLESLPDLVDLLQQPQLKKFVVATLGCQSGLVRVLYFDKPPGRSWSLPWHKDRTIAVQRNDLPSEQFTKPTTKAGVAHVEAPESLLREMLTLRLHLDPMTAENGPLSVIPGSHLDDDSPNAEPVELHAAAGTILAMRPLLSHSSSLPKQGTGLHRRIIHFELAPRPELPEGYQWHRFLALD